MQKHNESLKSLQRNHSLDVFLECKNKDALINKEWGLFFMHYSVLSTIPGILCTYDTHENPLSLSHP